MRKTILFSAVALALAVSTVWAGEVEEVAKIAQAYGIADDRVEYRLDDASRVDVLLDHYAVEADWSHKWAEGIGQALFYSVKTDRLPAVLLLLEKDKSIAAHQRYLDRCEIVCRQYHIALFYVEEGSTNVVVHYNPFPTISANGWETIRDEK